MKLGQIVSPGFAGSLRKLNDAEIPILTAWDLKIITALVDTEASRFEDLRRKLVEKYAEADDEGKPKKSEKGGFRVDPAKMESFMKEINDLMELDIAIEPVKLSALGKEAIISARDLKNLEGLVVK